MLEPFGKWQRDSRFHRAEPPHAAIWEADGAIISRLCSLKHNLLKQNYYSGNYGTRPMAPGRL
jgi:hypothetical protein